MRLALTLGAAISAFTMTASAQPHEAPHPPRVMVLHGGMGMGASADANNDGWISRNEASEAADAQFARLDENNDGRLSEEERGGGQFHIRVGEGDDNCTRAEEGDANDRRVRVECHVVRVGEGEGPRIVMAPHAPGAPGERNVIIHRIGPDGQGDDNCERTETNEGGNRRITVTCTGEGENRVVVTTDERGDVTINRNGEDENCTRTESGEGERRRVIVRCGDGGHPVIAPLPPMPPMPGVMPMMFGGSSEADRNNDGVLSREEHRAQALRWFDAADANGDRRIQAPPRPPEPPAPPAAPQPPRR
jgi:hypothetical protein